MTDENLQKEYETLEYLRASKILLRMQDGLEGVNELYQSLNCDIRLLRPDDKRHKTIQRSLLNTKQNYILKIKNIYEITKPDQALNYENRGNERLLFHGSLYHNFAGILSAGLKMAPAEAVSTGYMYGKGIYFADMCSKSIWYTRARQGEDFLLIICQVSLGE